MQEYTLRLMEIDLCMAEITRVLYYFRLIISEKKKKSSLEGV